MTVAGLSDKPKIEHETVVRMLGQPNSYPERPTAVQHKETHMSRVFLTDRYVYKLKKPVRFEFADFRSPEARQQACAAEVRLNRRLAEDVYLGVVPITLDNNGMLRLGGEGAPVDWVVKMRRLKEDRMLDQLLKSGHLRQHDLRRFASLLADFYHRAPPVVLEPERYCEEIERHVRANRQELLSPIHAASTSLVKRVHTAQLLFLKSSPQILAARVCDGRIIDGHGDLRPEHVCLEYKPVIFDCLEFNSELRRLDVLDELAFFAMECEFLGADFVGQLVIDAYLQVSGDSPPSELLWFYKSYRACVRAKVAALRAGQLSRDAQSEVKKNVRGYLDLADRYAAQLSSPFLLVMRGLMGTGKTTLATELADTLGVERIGTDDVRKTQRGLDPSPESFNAGRYAPQERKGIYQELFSRGSGLLERGESLVLDGTFLKAATLQQALELADRRGVRLLTITCSCPPDIARGRIAQRLADGEDASEARPDLLAEQQRQIEPVPEGIPTVEVDATEILKVQVNAVLRRLGHMAQPIRGRSDALQE
jgi:aminoglycoside phosphotransferase family enzyme/predicted kinase